MKVYLANGLFSLSDILFNNLLAIQIREKFPELELYLPQENEAINNKQGFANSTQISSGDDSYLLESDFMIAVIDGATIDEGVSCEIGKYQGVNMVYEDYRPIFALYTDSRQLGRDNLEKLDALRADAVENQFPYRNLYVIGTIKDSGGGIYSNIDDLLSAIEKYMEVQKNK